MKKQDKDGFENVFNMAFGSMIGMDLPPLSGCSISRVGGQGDLCGLGQRPDRPVYLTSKGTEKFYIRAGNMSQALSVSRATQYIQSRFARA